MSDSLTLANLQRSSRKPLSMANDDDPSISPEADVDLKNQAEHELIETSLEVEQLDTNLFRSKRLYVPVRARGVFGGQVISQAIVSATNCVDEVYGLHVCTQPFTIGRMAYLNASKSLHVRQISLQTPIKIHS